MPDPTSPLGGMVWGDDKFVELFSRVLCTFWVSPWRACLQRVLSPSQASPHPGPRAEGPQGFHLPAGVSWAKGRLPGRSFCKKSSCWFVKANHRHWKMDSLSINQDIFDCYPRVKGQTDSGEIHCNSRKIVTVIIYLSGCSHRDTKRLLLKGMRLQE